MSRGLLTPIQGQSSGIERKRLSRRRLHCSIQRIYQHPATSSASGVGSICEGMTKP